MAACHRCPGHARSYDGRHEVRPGRGIALLDFWRGVRDAARAPFVMLHGSAFVGLLRVPVTANAIAMIAIGLFGWFALLPAFRDFFASSWGPFDTWRSANAVAGPATWLLTTWLFVGPSLLDVATGALHEPVRIAAERTMLGEAPAAEPTTALRLTERARVLGCALMALPLGLACSLIPWVGLPLVALTGAAIAALVWFEPPMAARGMELPERLRLLRANRWRALGVGCGLQIAAAVPFVNLLALGGTATVAATGAYLHFDKNPAPAARRSG